MTAYRGRPPAPAAVPPPGAPDGPEPAASMPGRIREAWLDMPGSTRRLLAENPSEGRLLFYVIASDMVFFLSWALKTLLAPTAAAAAALPLHIGLWLIAALLLRTLSLYAFAALARTVGRAFGGTAGWREARAGVFWGALVAAPFGLLAALLGLAVAAAEPAHPFLGAPVFALPPYYIGLVPFLWFVAAGLATAHGFARGAWTFLALSTGTVALSLAGVYLSG